MRIASNSANGASVFVFHLHACCRFNEHWLRSRLRCVIMAAHSCARSASATRSQAQHRLGGTEESFKLQRDFGPLFIESFGGDGQGRAELLREERYAEFFDHPAE